MSEVDALVNRRLRVGGLLDRHVAIHYSRFYGGTLVALLGVMVTVELASRAGDTSKAATLLGFVRYQALGLPDKFLQVAPMTAMFAGLLSASRFLKTQEILAALASGCSARRFLAPMLVLGGVNGLVMLAVQEWLLPGPVLLARSATSTADPESRADLIVRSREGDIVRAGRYVPALGSEVPAAVEDFEYSGLVEGSFWNLRASRAVYSSFLGTWQLEDEHVYPKFDGAMVSRLLASFQPSDFDLALANREGADSLTLGGIQELLSRDPDNSRLVVLFHSRFTSALSGLICLLLALPAITASMTAPSARAILTSMHLCFLFIAVDFAARAAGEGGAAHAVLAAWGTPLVFGVVGTLRYTFAGQRG